ncbi:hypothetical protein ACFT2C_04825 [Promicromonospora sp. NPDC057138]|uniref:hypothetical protein n=1 Tax=Promicromonospora sp. NPDC057138 TaxID=3346031 RepID=UPI00362F6CA9
MLINECYATAPWAAVGNIVPDPVEPDLTTVAPLGGDFGRALSDALATHTDIAIDDRLYAQERPPRSNAPRPPSPGHPPTAGPGRPTPGTRPDPDTPGL